MTRNARSSPKKFAVDRVINNRILKNPPFMLSPVEAFLGFSAKS
jgi:hypothetical protein